MRCPGDARVAGTSTLGAGANQLVSPPRQCAWSTTTGNALVALPALLGFIFSFRTRPPSLVVCCACFGLSRSRCVRRRSRSRLHAGAEWAISRLRESRLWETRLRWHSLHLSLPTDASRLVHVASLSSC